MKQQQQQTRGAKAREYKKRCKGPPCQRGKGYKEAQQGADEHIETQRTQKRRTEERAWSNAVVQNKYQRRRQMAETTAVEWDSRSGGEGDVVVQSMSGEGDVVVQSTTAKGAWWYSR